MTSTNQQIGKYLSKDLCIQRDLDRGIINTRALAKFLIKRYGLVASLDSVISAIRRHDVEKSFKKQEREVMNVLKEASILTKTRIAMVEVRQDANFIKKLGALDDGISGHLKLITGTESFKILTESENTKKLKEIFKKSILEIIDNLSAISITLNKRAMETKGVLARMANEISLHNINIIEIITCVPEVIVYVEQKDLVKTHGILMKLARGLEI